MSFRKILKKRYKKKIPQNPTSGNNEFFDTSHSNNGSHDLNYTNSPNTSSTPAYSRKSLMQVLYGGHGYGLSRLSTWLPLFLGAWLVSGIVLNNISLLSLVILPLLLISTYGKLVREQNLPYQREMKLVIFAIIIITCLFINDWYNSFPIAVLALISSILLFVLEELKVTSTRSAVLRALSQSILPALLSQIGIMSQTSTENKVLYLGYLIIGFVPGTILGARELILSYEIFQKSGWTLAGKEFQPKQSGKIKTEDHEKVKFRPGGYTRLVLAFILTGPILPSLLLPFSILPETFLLSSLIFVIFPKLAETIQERPDSYSLVAIHLANIAAGLSVLMFIAGLLAKWL
ncbi:MAG TPA: hypothetical protein PKA63_01670 [Oligoflexia bacterium]|nr:hypothetical protein [Oligoflexia bacterium]HMP47358.1 hypothetical protein [Oligoflexia bacterium]